MDIKYSQLTSLISSIHSAAAEFLKFQLEADGLPEFTTSHGNILFQLSQAEKLTMTELAKRVHRDKSTATVLVRKLEKAGFVIRKKSQTDNRITFIALSEKGLSYTRATEKISRKLNETGYAGFSEQEKEILYTLLEKVAGNFSGAWQNGAASEAENSAAQAIAVSEQTAS
ncbi:MAG: MarR family transcriptional regulator [Bacteroides sp.]|nr:MarR family transcriptional regulator [Prevotella sp.]MCM1408437.1 MarR family transcriptional regulator [Treponema brennaborense]MCM1469401.1 MarR family transcriptional regulator [Bacteroides sp.]